MAIVCQPQSVIDETNYYEMLSRTRNNIVQSHNFKFERKYDVTVPPIKLWKMNRILYEKQSKAVQIPFWRWVFVSILGDIFRVVVAHDIMWSRVSSLWHQNTQTCDNHFRAVSCVPWCCAVLCCAIQFYRSVFRCVRMRLIILTKPKQQLGWRDDWESKLLREYENTQTQHS